MSPDSAMPRRARPRLSRLTRWTGRVLISISLCAVVLTIASALWMITRAGARSNFFVMPGEIQLSWNRNRSQWEWPWNGWSAVDVERGMSYTSPTGSVALSLSKGLLRMPYHRVQLIGGYHEIGCSLGLIALVFALPGFGLIALSRRWRLSPGACRACGYALTGLAPDTPCPECGRERSRPA